MQVVRSYLSARFVAKFLVLAKLLVATKDLTFRAPRDQWLLEKLKFERVS
ncbi:hypothetical protein GBA52_015920 [Prunus armeniaca]|nr:hypothetical protein GBA52_015920 [Prunus armeniaca]